MSVYGGPADWWTNGTDAGRTHIATKGIVQSGLVLNLDPGVSSSYPGSGTTLSDLSGNAFNATLTDGPTFTTDNGGALVFDGTNDTVQGVHNATLDLTGNLTIECWFRVTSTRADWVRVFGKGTSLLRTYGLWYNYSANNFLYQRTRSNGTIFDAVIVFPITVNLNVWYHIAATSSGTSHILYVNGVQVGSATSSLSTFDSTTSPYIIGYGNAHVYHFGNIGPCRLYSRALTAAEVLQNFNALRGRFGV
jgi:hypothetical protein